MGHHFKRGLLQVTIYANSIYKSLKIRFPHTVFGNLFVNEVPVLTNCRLGLPLNVARIEGVGGVDMPIAVADRSLNIWVGVSILSAKRRKGGVE